MKPLITQEIGSFRKPEYLSNVFRKASKKELDPLKLKAMTETVKLFEKAGLDNIGIGGEMYRWEMYEHLAAGISGIEFYGMVRSFDNRYFRKGSVVNRLKKKENVHIEELKAVMSVTDRSIKVPITGPYTMMDWSFNDFYGSREELANEYAAIINDEIREIRNFWYSKRDTTLEIQIDEPALTTHPEEMDIGVNSLNRSMEGIKGCEFSLHVCYSTDYNILYRRIGDMGFHGYNLEFANRIVYDRPGGKVVYDPYKTVKDFVDYSGGTFLGLGVTDVHIDDVESMEVIHQRINTALKFIDPEKLRINPDCGLRTRSREIGYSKLKNMVDARDLALRELQ
jgi:5-methyltetrahydropteroyltriglutamate--homocysteine methyltransferase